MNYSFTKYDTQSRWQSYWHQINQVLKQNPNNVLEIGVGNKLVSDYLRKQGIKVITADVNKNLNPDVEACVLNLPFENNAFDVVLCCEVLEHLPFNHFEQALGEIKRVTKQTVILSLPHFGPPIKLSFKIPFLKEIKLAFKIPFPKKHIKNEHFWEIGKKDYPLKKIKSTLQKHFVISQTFIPFENQYHCFFVLKV